MWSCLLVKYRDGAAGGVARFHTLDSWETTSKLHTLEMHTKSEGLKYVCDGFSGEKGHGEKDMVGGTR